MTSRHIQRTNNPQTPPVLLKAHKCLFIKDFRYCFQNAAFYLAKDHLLKDKRLALESQKATLYNVG